MIPNRIFWLFDLLVLVAAFLAAYFLLPAMEPLFGPTSLLRAPWLQALMSPAAWTGHLPPLLDLVWLLLATAPATIVVMALLGNHTLLFYQSRTRIILGGCLGLLASLSVVALVLLALKRPDWSRLFVFLYISFGSLGLSSYRLVARHFMVARRAAGYYAQNVLLIGLPASIEWMAFYFADHVPAVDYRLIGYLRVSSDQRPPDLPHNSKNGTIVARLAALGKVKDLGNLLICRPIHQVIVIHPMVGGEWIAQVIQTCDRLGVVLRIVPEALLLGERRTLHTLYPFEPLHLPAVVLTPPHWHSDELFLKRLFDMVGSGVLLVLFAPLLGLIALAIKITEPHLPVLYPWRVVGQNGVEFTSHKFRTMVPNADALKAQLMQHNEMTGPVFKMKDDPRITPLGRFLRRYSLDELPQLWSVLKGDMSLVGPRPAGRHELERYEFWQKRKLSIQPGITCLWQVRGRNRVNRFDDWVKMDLEYIDGWSLWLDLRILLRTAWVVIAGTGM